MRNKALKYVQKILDIREHHSNITVNTLSKRQTTNIFRTRWPRNTRGYVRVEQ